MTFLGHFCSVYYDLSGDLSYYMRAVFVGFKNYQLLCSNKTSCEMIQTRKMPLFLIVLLVMLAGCNRNAELCLTMADECLETDPNRAFKYLSELEDVDNLSDELQARYALLYTQTTYNCNIPFTNDSLINIAVNYYTRHGKRHDAAKARRPSSVIAMVEKPPAPQPPTDRISFSSGFHTR